MRSSAPNIKMYSSVNASTSIGERFFPTGTKVAIFGLVTAIITLVFTIGVEVSIYRQTHIRFPLAERTTRVHTAIVYSMSTLGTWIIRGRPEDRETFNRVWPEHIVPAVTALQEITNKRFVGTLRQEVEVLCAKLRELERLQHLVADLAHVPGKSLAEETYQLEAEPIGRFLLQMIDRSLEQTAPYTFPAATVSQLLNLKVALLEIQNALILYLRHETPSHQHRLTIARKKALQLASTWADKAPDNELTEGMKEAMHRVTAYDHVIEKLMAQRSRPGGDLFTDYFTQDLLPVLRSIVTQTQAMAGNQGETMLKSGQRIAQGSAVVVLLALMMGLLSAANLYTSLQAKHRVQRFAAKAERLGQYAIGKRLGEGSVGAVYQAQHALLRRPTAIKVLRPSHANNLRAQERFRAEVQLTSQLTHPNTIDIFDYGQTKDGVFYYAMELLEGINLDTLVTHTGPVPPHRLVYLMRQICGSLSEAHSKGLLHRDIKPSNIMLTERGGIYDTVKVVDFGLVQLINPHEHPQHIEGTPMFLAPEIIVHGGAASPRSDLYALGGVMYFLLTQQNLFEEEDVASILQAHLEQPIIPPSERILRPIPADIETIIMSCLAKDPQERPESAAHVAALIEECRVAPWTEEDARVWWADYGEALKGRQYPIGSATTNLRISLDSKDRTVT